MLKPFSNRRGMLLRLAIVSCLSIPLASCLTIKPTLSTGTNPACLALKPVMFSSQHDTPETVQQVRENNAALIVICPELKPKP